MKIGIDVRCFFEGRQTGVEEYTANLLKNIFKEDDKNEYILFFNAFKKSNADFKWIKDYPNVSLKTFRFPNKLLNLSLWYLRYPQIDKMIGGVDYFFMPNINFIALSRKTKLILNIHDLSFEYFPETYSWKRRLWHWILNPKSIAKKAYKITTVSQSTKNDLIDNYKIPKEKIEVIYNGISDKFRKIDKNNPKLLEIKDKYNLPFNFIFFLGTFEPRKNIIGVVKAYEWLRENNSNDFSRFKLAIGGSPGWKSNEIKRTIEKSKFRKDILLLNFVKDEDKVYLYNLAAVFVYPSFFEGFGIPPLEAMRSGTNVVASNNSSLPETVGAGGILVDADRPEEIALAIKEIILNKNIGEILNKEKVRQLQKFSWGKSARKFLQIIDDIKS